MSEKIEEQSAQRTLYSRLWDVRSTKNHCKNRCNGCQKGLHAIAETVAGEASACLFVLLKLEGKPDSHGLKEPD